MSERGSLAAAARKIVAQHGVSLRQAYRYAAAGRSPSDCVRVGTDGRRYHVHEDAAPRDPVQARRIRYAVAGVAKRAGEHGITAGDVAELETAAAQIADLVAVWRSWTTADTSLL